MENRIKELEQEVKELIQKNEELEEKLKASNRNLKICLLTIFKLEDIAIQEIMTNSNDSTVSMKLETEIQLKEARNIVNDVIG